jgi:hypothetical protein
MLRQHVSSGSPLEPTISFLFAGAQLRGNMNVVRLRSWRAVVRELDVFGRPVLIQRQAGEWVAFYPGADGKRSRAHDLLIPSFIATEDELLQYLADLCHEWATPEHDRVRWVR